ncbi:hypothetical protein AOB46_05235 [Chryseobacterium indologenes]|uniref:Uncharacterized protein n=2 Tax=Chryseobacterium indologenes TaxID=253 RepID=A0A0N0IXJ6_CHRID|nr:hypothetical protein AOB46_05235 [Chryseobacterium indologenes]
MKTDFIEKKTNVRMIWICFISCFIFFFIAVKASMKQRVTFDNSTEIKGVLKENIKIKKGKRGSETLIISLKEYPEIKFVIGSIVIDQTYTHELMSENKQDDTLSFSIESTEFRSKILRSEKIPFPENYLRNNTISIVEIHKNNLQYLTMDDYNKAHQKNTYLLIAFFGFMGILMLFVGAKGVRYYRANYR